MPEDIKTWFESKQSTLVDFKLSVLQSTSDKDTGESTLREIMKHEQSIQDGTYTCCLSEDL